MNIESLIKGAPGLFGDLQGVGLSEQNVGDLGREIGNQIGDGGLDLTSLLSGLDTDSFLGSIDVAAIASKIGVSPEMASQALKLIAPKVAEFTGGGSALGGLSGLAKGLLGGRD